MNVMDIVREILQFTDPHHALRCCAVSTIWRDAVEGCHSERFWRLIYITINPHERLGLHLIRDVVPQIRNPMTWTKEMCLRKSNAKMGSVFILDHALHLIAVVHDVPSTASFDDVFVFLYSAIGISNDPNHNNNNDDNVNVFRCLDVFTVNGVSLMPSRTIAEYKWPCRKGGRAGWFGPIVMYARTPAWRQLFPYGDELVKNPVELSFHNHVLNHCVQ